MRGHLILTDRRAGSAVDGFADRFSGNHTRSNFWVGILDELTRDHIAAGILRLRFLRLRTGGSLRFACVSTLRSATLHAALLARGHARLTTRVAAGIGGLSALTHTFAERLRLLLGHIRERLRFRKHLLGHLEF